MKHKFEDILRLYIGCKCKVEKLPGTINCHDGKNILEGLIIDLYPKHFKNIELYLRPMEDQSEEEAFGILRMNHLEYITFVSINKEFIRFRIQRSVKRSKVYKKPFPVIPITPNAVLYAAKAGLDIFGLIDEGLAIDLSKPE